MHQSFSKDDIKINRGKKGVIPLVNTCRYFLLITNINENQAWRKITEWAFFLTLHCYLKQASILADLNQCFLLHPQKTSIKKYLQKLKSL